MKKLYLLLTCLFFATNFLVAQTTETFETETGTSFTDNGQVFNMTSQEGGPFDVQTGFPGFGWSGSGADNRFVDNDGFANFTNNCEFTISSQGATTFTLKSLWLYLADYNANVSVAGNLTITGKLGGATVFTANSTPGFNNTNGGVNNGFTLINMATFGGSNNSNAVIDSFVIRTTDPFNYVAMDAMTWQVACSAPIITAHPPNRTICNNSNTTFTVTATAATGYQWQVNTGSGFTNVSGGVYSGATTATLTITGATTAMNGFTYRVIVSGACLPNATSNAGLLTVMTISSTGSQNNVLCNGGSTGSATVTPTSGVAPYTYSWSPSGGSAATASNLSAGAYTVTITDALGCTGTRTFTITQPSVINGATVVTNVACNGNATGAINLVPSGGIGPYTYNWGGGITTEDRTGLTAGTYSVTITDANACTRTVSGITVTQPSAAVSGTTVVTNVACFGGTTGAINLTPTGGTGPYTYDWGGGITSEDRTLLTAGTYSVTITDANGCTGTVSGITVSQPAAVVSGTTVVTNVACFGNATGAINLTPTGGTGPYTYNWGGGITTEDRVLLAAGTYSVTITDANGCTGTVSGITVSQPAAAVSGTTVVTNVSCFGGINGAINLTPTGGTGPYTFNWNTGQTTEDRVLLAAGTYSVTITDANGCTGTVSGITLSQPTVLDATASAQTNIACNGGATGSATVGVTGGTPGYTYSWAPSGGTAATATGLTAGTYTVTVTDANGCTDTQSFTLTQPPALTATTSQVNTLCGTGGQAGVTVSGGTPGYTYLWSPSGGTGATATGLTAGSYSVTVTDANGCTLVRNFTITSSSTLTATTSQTNVACNGGTTGVATITVSAGTAPYTYVWSPSGGTAATATGLAAGAYSVTATDANGCDITRNFTITQPSAFTVGTSQTNVSCNAGANGTATVSVSGATAPYTYSWSPSGGTAATASGLAAGSYTVTITDNNACQTTRNFTITQPSAFTVGTSQTDVSCNGGANGTATVSVSGATAPYTYSWSPSGGTAATASGLTAGTYTVTITDNNACQTTRNFTIAQPASALDATASAQTNIACNGAATGSATVAVTGGTPGYTYSWAPSGGTAATATGLVAGTYTVTVTDANGCTDTQSFTLTQPPVLDATAAAQTNIACNGGATGSATVAVTGGTGAYTYLWAPSGGTAATATGLVAGTYTVTVTDANGCTDTQSFTITQPPVLNATAAAQTNILCNGGATGAATVGVTGGTPGYTYSWAPSGGTAATATGLVAGTYTVTVTDANGCTDTQSFTITQPSALTATTSQTNVSCNGGVNGVASVTVSGGTGAYTYSWSPSGGTAATASGLAAGAYTVTITDANLCQITRNFTITQPPVLNATALAQTNIACNGGATGSATVAVTGGTGAYTYLWAPSGGTAATATGLTAGTYTVTVTDANGCTDTQSFTITQPSAFTVGTSQTNVSCNGGANGVATVSVSGATGPYTYSWAPSGGTGATASGLAAGTYTVTITDGNLCQTTRNFTITQPSAFTVGTSQTNVSCNGGANGTATVAVSGATPGYTYSWSPSGGTAATATGLVAGNYTVTITDANTCQTTRNFTITQPSALTATTSQTNVSCNGGANGTASVVVSGGTAAYTYSWAPSGGTAATASGLVVGNYTVTVTDANGCTLTRNFTITQPSALTATTSQTNVSCNGGSNGVASVTVSGGTGVYTYSWAPSGGTAATATGLAAGTYTVTITDANACQITRNFTITQPSVLTATTSQTNVSCNGGANGVAGVTVSGGTPGYTYSWAPSGGTAATATGLAAGIYTVTITDANACQITRTITVTQPAALTATTSLTNVSCNGGANGAATVTVSGGTPAYTYSWSPSGGTGATASGLAAGTYTVTITDANACQITRTVTITQPTALTATTSQTNALCNGGANGTATVTPAGGTAPYTYSWAPSGGTAATATGLAAGTYTVTITDANGCSITRTVTITQPTAITATTSQTNLSCNGGANGTATVTASGGTGAYTYSWAPSGGTGATATGLAAGTYTVTIRDANLCQITRTVTLTQPTAITATTTQTNVSCNGGVNGSATVAATGGTGAYTYSWSPSGGTAASATGLAAGTYTVTITDANLCQTTRAVTITQPAVLAATSTQTNVSCNGGSNGTATMAVTGGTAPYTYSWSPSGGTAATATGLVAGTYTVIITDANLCSITRTVTITQPTALAATTTQTNILCNGGTNGTATVTVTGGTGAYTYSWAPSGGTAATATGLAAGTYTVTITDANLCQITRTVTLTQPTAITATTTQTNVSCNGGVNGSATVAVTGGTGAYTYSWSPSGGTGATASGLSAGAYTVTITDANLCQITRTVTITQPTLLAATTTQTNVSCNGGVNGSATVTVTGGTPAYTYAWTPSGGTGATATGLAAGIYTVTITDANGCTLIRTVTINQPAALTAVSSQTNVSCNGGTDGVAGVVVSGGTAPYTYAWSPSGGTAATATGLAAGTYTVTVTDGNGCIFTQTFTITEPTPLAATTTQANVLCHGNASGSATITVTGGTPGYTYLWSPSGGTAATATGLTAGTYTVTATDVLGCQIVENITITEPTALTAVATQTNVSCNGGSNGSATVSVSGGTNAYGYLWSPSGGTAAIADGLSAGTYTVTVTDTNGCVLTETFTITEPVAMVVTNQPDDVFINTGDNATYSISGTNNDGYKWQVSTNGTDWTDVVNGGTNPVYAGATTNTLTLTNVPVEFDGYLYRGVLVMGTDCFVSSDAALLTVTNVLEAIDDEFNDAAAGAVAGDVTENDLMNDIAVDDTDVTISVIDNGGLTGVTIDADGNIHIPASTPFDTYTVVYSICDNLDLTNCSEAEVTIVVTSLGIDEVRVLEASIYPNPATTEVFVKIPEISTADNAKVVVYDLNGRLITQEAITSDSQKVDISSYESGVYIFTITSDRGTTTKRIVKSKY